MHKFKGIILVLLCLSLSIFANDRYKIDGLPFSLHSQNDSARTSTLLSAGWNLRNSNPDQSIIYFLEAIEIAKKCNDFENLAKAYSFMGVAYRVLGNYSKSIDYYYNGLKIAVSKNIEEQEGYAYLNIANLQIYQEYHNQAIDNIKKAKIIAKKFDNRAMLAYVHLYHGRALLLKNEYDLALKKFHKALSIRQELNQVPEQAVCYKYIGDIYFEKKQFENALENYNLSIKTLDQTIDRNLYANNLVQKSMIYLETNNLLEASKLANQSLSIANEVGASLLIRDASQVLATISLRKNDFKLASFYLQSVITYNNLLFGQQLSEKILFLEYQLDKQQRENEIEILSKNNTIKELELIRVKIFNVALSAFLTLLVSVFIVVLFIVRERRKRAELLEVQNQEIISQRISIEQKNIHLQNACSVIERYVGNITNSIQYAKKIQEAILPNLNIVKPFFSDSFCLHLPKEFVSGDFYWITIRKNTLIVALADCTGHGVPGAFMSIIGMDLLSQAVNQEGLTEPAKIIDFINVELRSKLRKEDEDEQILKDSLDLAVFTMELGSKILYYSGALIPITIIRDNQIIEYKPQFASIGMSLKLPKKPFKNQTIEVLANDWIYLYSDGFMDQFGEKNKKKYMRSNFFSSLISISVLNGTEQEKELFQKFYNWKGNNEQIDDVLVLGFKV